MARLHGDLHVDFRTYWQAAHLRTELPADCQHGIAQLFGRQAARGEYGKQLLVWVGGTKRTSVLKRLVWGITIDELGGGKSGLQSVVVPGGDGIEFVVEAPGATEWMRKQCDAHAVDELIVWLIRIEAANNIVAIPPRIGAGEIIRESRTVRIPWRNWLYGFEIVVAPPFVRTVAKRRRYL
ncbi:MAG: hypothetical protein QF473_24500, partial [Planctomycetota bacterium]|nr:hypothetical protein [Planctomycetota bacterium]